MNYHLWFFNYIKISLCKLIKQLEILQINSSQMIQSQPFKSFVIMQNRNNPLYMSSYGFQSPQIRWQNEKNNIGVQFQFKKKGQDETEEIMESDIIQIYHNLSNSFLCVKMSKMGFRLSLTKQWGEITNFQMQSVYKPQQIIKKETDIGLKLDQQPIVYLKHSKNKGYLSTNYLNDFSSFLEIQKKFYFLNEHLRMYWYEPDHMPKVIKYWKILKEQNACTCLTQSMSQIIKNNLKMLISKYQSLNPPVNASDQFMNYYQRMQKFKRQILSKIRNNQLIFTRESIKQVHTQIYQLAKQLHGVNIYKEQKPQQNSQKMENDDSFVDSLQQINKQPIFNQIMELKAQFARSLTICDFVCSFQSNESKQTQQKDISSFFFLMNIERDCSIHRSLYSSIPYYREFILKQSEHLCHQLIRSFKKQILAYLMENKVESSMRNLQCQESLKKLLGTQLGVLVHDLIETLFEWKKIQKILINEIVETLFQLYAVFVLFEIEDNTILETNPRICQYLQKLKNIYSCYKKNQNKQLTQLFNSQSQLNSFMKRNKQLIPNMLMSTKFSITLCDDKNAATQFKIISHQDFNEDIDEQDLQQNIFEQNHTLFDVFSQQTPFNDQLYCPQIPQINFEYQNHDLNIKIEGQQRQIKKRRDWLFLLELPTKIAICRIQSQIRKSMNNKEQFENFKVFIHQYRIFEIILQVFLDNIYPKQVDNIYSLIKKMVIIRPLKISTIRRILTSQNIKHADFTERIICQLLPYRVQRVDQNSFKFLQYNRKQSQQNWKYAKKILKKIIKENVSQSQIQKFISIQYSQNNVLSSYTDILKQSSNIQLQEYALKQICKQVRQLKLQNKEVQIIFNLKYRDFLVKNQINIKVWKDFIFNSLDQMMKPDQIIKLKSITQTDMLYFFDQCLELFVFLIRTEDDIRKQTFEKYQNYKLYKIVNWQTFTFKHLEFDANFIDQKIQYYKHSIIQKIVTIQILYYNFYIKKWMFSLVSGKEKQKTKILNKIQDIPITITKYSQLLNKGNSKTDSIILIFIQYILDIDLHIQEAFQNSKKEIQQQVDRSKKNSNNFIDNLLTKGWLESIIEMMVWRNQLNRQSKQLVRIITNSVQIYFYELKNVANIVKFSLHNILYKFDLRKAAQIQYEPRKLSLLNQIKEMHLNLKNYDEEQNKQQTNFFRIKSSKFNAKIKSQSKYGKYNDLYWNILALYSLILDRRNLNKKISKQLIKILSDYLSITKNTERYIICYLLLEICQQAFRIKIDSNILPTNFQTKCENFAIDLLKKGNERNRWQSIITCKILHFFIQCVSKGHHGTFDFFKIKIANNIQDIILANASIICRQKQCYTISQNIKETQWTSQKALDQKLLQDQEKIQSQRFYRTIIGAEIQYLIKKQGIVIYQQLRERSQLLLSNRSQKLVLNLFNLRLQDLIFALQKLNGSSWRFQSFLISSAQSQLDSTRQLSQKFFECIKDTLVKAQKYVKDKAEFSIQFRLFLMRVDLIIQFISSKKHKCKTLTIVSIVESLFKLRKLLTFKAERCRLFEANEVFSILQPYIRQEKIVEDKNQAKKRLKEINSAKIELEQQQRIEVKNKDQNFRKVMKKLKKSLQLKRQQNYQMLLPAVLNYLKENIKQLPEKNIHAKLVNFLEKLHPTKSLSLLDECIIPLFEKRFDIELQTDYKPILKIINLCGLGLKQFPQQYKKAFKLKKVLQEMNFLLQKVIKNMLYFYDKDQCYETVLAQDDIFIKHQYQKNDDNFIYCLSQLIKSVVDIVDTLCQDESFISETKNDLGSLISTLVENFSIFLDKYISSLGILVNISQDSQKQYLQSLNVLYDPCWRIVRFISKVAQRSYRAQNFNILNQIVYRKRFFIFMNIQMSEEAAALLKDIKKQILKIILNLINASSNYCDTRQDLINQLKKQLEQSTLYKFMQKNKQNKQGKILMYALHKKNLSSAIQVQKKVAQLEYRCSKGKIASAYMIDDIPTISATNRKYFINMLLNFTEQDEQIAKMYNHRKVIYPQFSSQNLNAKKYHNLLSVLFNVLFFISCFVIFFEVMSFPVSQKYISIHMKDRKLLNYTCMIHLILSVLLFIVYCFSIQKYIKSLRDESKLQFMERNKGLQMSKIQNLYYFVKFFFQHPMVQYTPIVIVIISLFSMLFDYTIHSFMFLVLLEKKKYLQNLISPFKHSWREILILFILSGIFAFIFGNILLPIYVDSFKGTSQFICSSIMGCIITLFTQDIVEQAIPVDNPNLYSLFLSNTLYWIIFTTLFGSSISGFIVNGFEQQRKKTLELQQQRKAKCLICGETSKQIQKTEKTFDQHIKKHSIWRYLYLLYQIQNSQQKGLIQSKKQKGLIQNSQQKELESYKLYLKEQFKKAEIIGFKKQLIFHQWLPIKKDYSKQQQQVQFLQKESLKSIKRIISTNFKITEKDHAQQILNFISSKDVAKNGV